jgi:hypothetical protein
MAQNHPNGPKRPKTAQNHQNSVILFSVLQIDFEGKAPELHTKTDQPEKGQKGNCNCPRIPKSSPQALFGGNGTKCSHLTPNPNHEKVTGTDFTPDVSVGVGPGCAVSGRRMWSSVRRRRRCEVPAGGRGGTRRWSNSGAIAGPTPAPRPEKPGVHLKARGIEMRRTAHPKNVRQHAKK